MKIQSKVFGQTKNNEEVILYTIETSKIKIEILNGSGNSKKLQKAVSELEGAGYKVTRTGTTNSTSKTTIIDKKDVSRFLNQQNKNANEGINNALAEALAKLNLKQ